MKKSILLFVMLFVLLTLSFTAFAVEQEEPVLYKDTITVTEDGGRYKLGFVEVEFKKEYMDSNMLPTTFQVEVYAENGQAYIEFSPDAEKFIKKVHIRAKKYEGPLYDKVTGENIEVNIKSQQILVKHFSRYGFHD